LKVHSSIKGKKKLAKTVRINFFRTLEISLRLSGLLGSGYSRKMVESL
jgi:hypothetical protein